MSSSKSGNPSQARRVRIVSLAGALVSVALAIAIPLAVPKDQQFEVLMLTFWFAGLGAVLFNTAGLYARMWPIRVGRIASGLMLASMGFVTPYARVLDSADERFYVTIALGPLALAGLILMWANRPWQPSCHERPVAVSIPSASREARVAVRAPNTPLYRNLLPISLGLLLVAVLIIVFTVMLPALLSLTR